MKKLEGDLMCNPFVRGALCAIAALGLAMALAGIGISPFSPNVAQAQTSDPDLEQKADWQERYRILLKNQVILADNAEKSRHDYAQAQRRNYPRGGARDQFLLNAAEAESELAELEKEATELLEAARRAGLPRSWFYEIDDEDIGLSTPAASGQADDEDDASREGRNPLYLD